MTPIFDKFISSQIQLHESSANPSPALTRAATGIKRSNRAMKILLNSEAGSGPMDGGCLICAKALIMANGKGDLVRLYSHQTEHYGAMVDGVIYDSDGAHRTEQEWIDNFSKSEMFTGPLTVEPGHDAESSIPDDPQAVTQLAKVLTKIIDPTRRQEQAFRDPGASV